MPAFNLQETIDMNTSKTLRKVAANLTVAACLFTLPISLPAHAASLDTSAGQLQVNQQIGRLVGAWGFDFLPDGSVIVTEKRGRLFIASKDGRKRRIRGLPEIVEDGQGGFLILWSRAILNRAKRCSLPT